MSFSPICERGYESTLGFFMMFDAYIFLLAYLIGSIPYGIILSRLFGYGDIRKIGSGNIGATNALRTGNKLLAFTTLLLDTSKGIFALMLLIYIQNTYPSVFPLPTNTFMASTDIYFQLPIQPYLDYCQKGLQYCEICGMDDAKNILAPQIIMLTGLFAIIGHCFPIWLKFKGGKGVATALGVFLAAVPYAGLAACVAWILTAKITKISSLSALIAVGIAPIVTLFIYGAAPAGICALITLLVWIRHKDNIKRLLKGKEPKIGADKKEMQLNQHE